MPLFDFKRFSGLAAGRSAAVSLSVQPQALTTVAKDGTETLSSGVYSVSLGGEPDGFAIGELVVTGSPKMVFVRLFRHTL